MKDKIRNILSKMTLEEKVAQLNSVEAKNVVDDNNKFSPEKAEIYLKDGIGHVAGVDYALYVLPEEAAEISNDLQEWLQKNTLLKIPAILHEECLAGLAARGAATNPHPLGLGSMWEPELVEKMAENTKKHVRSVGSHQALSPVLDICSDPRWGRCEETYGEDAYIVAANSKAYVKGLQGNDLKEGVAATAKHFVGHGFAEGGRNCAPIHMGSRELRDVSLFPFEVVVKECGVKSIMNAYHDIDGIPCAASRELLTDILRDEWGFDGVVVSDYYAVERLCSQHFTAETKGEAAKQALEAGLDVELPLRDCYGDELLELVRSGKMSESVIDLSVGRVLKLKFELGLFEGTGVDPAKAKELFAREENVSFAGELARKSIVLLKNEDGTLPLKKNLKSIAVIGPNAHSKRNLLGDYSFVSINSHFSDLCLEDREKGVEAAMARTLVTVLEGIRNKVSAETEIKYAKGCDIWDVSKDGYAEAIELAKNSEVAVVVVGDRGGMFQEGITSGEHVDRTEITLFGVQGELVGKILETGTPVVLVLINGKPLAVKEYTDRAAAVLETWFPGEQGGNAIADVLFGDYNPGGKLPVTLLSSLGQYPMSYNLKPVSYKDYIEEKAKPNFCFGHGMSYTSFEYADLEISPLGIEKESEVKISLSIKNTGTVYGEEVVQLYIRDEIASLARPIKELKGFKRMGLDPGETKKLEFRLFKDQLSFHNRDMKLVVEPGNFKVMLGSSSQDIRLEGSFIVTGELYEVKGNRKFFSEIKVY